MYFDRFDICEAYLAIEMDWNVSGLVNGKSYSSQLFRMGFKSSPLFKGFDSLSDNGKEIYYTQCVKLGLLDWEDLEVKELINGDE